MSGFANTLGKLDPGAALVNNVFGIGGKSQTPQVMPPAVMPTVNDASVEAARRAKIMELQARTGRASTIFTTGTETKVGG